MVPTRTTGVLRTGGRILGLSLARGKGTVDVLADVNVLSNYYLGKADNVLLAASLLLADAKGSVYFDEYRHGFGRAAEGPTAASQRAVSAALWLLILALALYCLSSMTRMGRAHAYLPQPRRSVGEYVRAVAGLYQRAHYRKAALETLAAAVRRRWALRLGISPRARPEQFAHAARQRQLPLASELQRALQEADALLEEREVSREALLRAATRLARLQNIPTR